MVSIDLHRHCGEPAISLHSHHASLVQRTTRLLLVMRDPGSIARGYLCEIGILLLALSRYNIMIPKPYNIRLVGCIIFLKAWLYLKLAK